MTAVVYQIRDYQSPKDLERMQRELEKEAAKIVGEISTGGVALGNEFPNEFVPYGGAGIDGMDLGKEPA